MAGEGAHRSGLRRTHARARGALRRLRLLLDTHIALWWANDPSELRDDARDAIAEGANDVFLSAASVWEAAIKAAAGRLTTPAPLERAARSANIGELRIEWKHARRAASLPALHRDPFDRMLVAQALDEGLVLLTRDPLVEQYAVSTMRA
jgi:PIN domain nuclease of toxin-antitoxin system